MQILTHHTSSGMGRVLLCLLAAFSCVTSQAADNKGEGRFAVYPLGPNAVRIVYTESPAREQLPDWLYEGRTDTHQPTDLSVSVDHERRTVVVKDKHGNAVFTATAHDMQGQRATLTIDSPDDERLYGMGQFQDGFTNIRQLPRRLTQVNTQTSIPMMLSSKGFGVLWNNYGLTELNPCHQRVALSKEQEEGQKETVSVTSTDGGKQEVRQGNAYSGTIDITEEGDYALLLDVGQKMARRHHLAIDGHTVIDMQNLWLPPTAPAIVHLQPGKHRLRAELTKDDQPVVYYEKTRRQTVLSSPVAQAVDYTVFVGSPDEIIAAYRRLTGPAPLMPRWALGYIHCRERFHSQDEIMQTAQRFRQENIPMDVIVQDWQYWGKYGWNAMRFDEDYYPAPRQLTDSLHQMDIRLMLSVWSKVDKTSDVGKLMEQGGHYIDGTDWIDFFSPAAASAYWQQFSKRLLPTGIDAWWMDATEPENDDLDGRLVNRRQWTGEAVRNVYPLLVSKTVCEGLRNEQPNRRPMILTRCGFAGIQRYGVALWSGDVGNDWETFRRQITAGLGVQAAGVPWWTYDAGGFFRPHNQYTDSSYIRRMLHEIETAVYLPLMRVHGYMSNTEPWNYPDMAKEAFANSIRKRKSLLPYIYSVAERVASEGYTLMRPMVFDFAGDAEALDQRYQYMFGPALLINPMPADNATAATYLPHTQGGWYDYHSGQHLDGGQWADRQGDGVQVFARAGSIVTEDTGHEGEIRVRIFPGADGSFTLYDDDGATNDYLNGKCARTLLTWDDATHAMTIGQREGSFKGMAKQLTFSLVMPDGSTVDVVYRGKQKKVKIDAAFMPTFQKNKVTLHANSSFTEKKA